MHIAIIAEECQKAKVELRFVTEPLDTSPEGMLIAYVKGYAAQMEREKIKDRTMRGIRARVLAGKLPNSAGRGAYGYRYDRETGRREVYEPHAQWVRQMYSWVAQDRLTCNAVARRLDRLGVPTPRGGRKWDVSSIDRLLRNPIYKGATYRFTMQVVDGHRRYRPPEDWVEAKEASPAIVPASLWDAAQSQISRNAELARRHAKKDYLLSGYIFCGVCGRRMHGRFTRYRSGQGRRCYECYGRSYSVYYPGVKCLSRRVHADEVEAVVWQEITGVLSQPEPILHEIERLKGREAIVLIDNELAEIENRLRTSEREEERLVRLYRYGEIDDSYIATEIHRLNGERAGLLTRRAALLEETQRHVDIEEAGAAIRVLMQKVTANLVGFGHDERRLALEAPGARVTIQPDGNLDLRLSVPISLEPARSCRTAAGPTAAAPQRESR